MSIGSAADAAMPKKGGMVCQPGRARAQGQKKGFLPKKSRSCPPQQTLQAHRPQQAMWMVHTPGASSVLSRACTEVTVGALGTLGPTPAMERPWTCGCLTGMSGAARPTSCQSREGNSREYTSACDLSDTRLQAQITHFTSDICCHGGRLEPGCLKFN